MDIYRVGYDIHGREVLLNPRYSERDYDQQIGWIVERVDIKPKKFMVISEAIDYCNGLLDIKIYREI